MISVWAMATPSTIRLQRALKLVPTVLISHSAMASTLMLTAFKTSLTKVQLVLKSSSTFIERERAQTKFKVVVK